MDRPTRPLDSGPLDSGPLVPGALVLPLVAVIGLLGCPYEEGLPFDPSDYEMSGHGIIGGSNTTGWPAVGVYFSSGGSMCTATLVDPEVVLTAAHCVNNTGNQDWWCRGHDINQMGGNDCHHVDQAIEHPSYNLHAQHTHDMAVLLLDTPTSATAPMPVNTSSMIGWSGDWVHYVGFGSNTYYGGPGAGIKRETDLQIDAIGTCEYQTYTSGTNVCSGDSGGPGLVDLGGDWHVIGVNSSVWSYSGDPCSGYGIAMRVDAELNFLDNYFDPYGGGDDDGGDDDGGDDDGGDDDGGDDDGGDDDGGDDDGGGDDDSIDPSDYPEPRINTSYDQPEGCACDAQGRSSATGLAALATVALLALRRRR